MDQQRCLETLRHVEDKLQVIQAMVIAKRPQDELLHELMAAHADLCRVEQEVAASRSDS